MSIGTTREKAGGFVVDSRQAWKKDTTLCWDCKNATNINKCPWACNNTPVDGWWARPTQVRMYHGYDHRMEDSFCVIMCPLFERDGWRGGIYQHDCVGKKTLKDTSPDDIRALAAAIIHQQIDDWEALDRGKHAKAIPLGGKVVSSVEVVKFFNSAWFASLLSAVSETPPSVVRKILGVPDVKDERKRNRSRT